MGTRAVATAEFALSAAEAVGGAAACSTGFGCIVGGFVGVHGLDSANAAGQTILTGKPHSSYGAQAISNLTGLSEQNAELSYDLVSVGANLKLMANAAKITSPSYRVFESGEEALQAYPHLFVEQEHIPSGVVNGSKGEAAPAVSITPSESDAIPNNNTASVTPRVEIEESPTNIIYSSEASTADVLAENKNIHLEHINNSSPVSEVEEIISPETDVYHNVLFKDGLPNHLIKVEAMNKRGIVGGHNMKEFKKFALENNVKIVGETEILKGIYEIEYQAPVLDRELNFTGNYKASKVKTVYDPEIYSDKTMLKIGKIAALKSYKENLDAGIREYDSSHEGITFRVYINKKDYPGRIDNFFPKKEIVDED